MPDTSRHLEFRGTEGVGNEIKDAENFDVHLLSDYLSFTTSLDT